MTRTTGPRTHIVTALMTEFEIYAASTGATMGEFAVSFLDWFGAKLAEAKRVREDILERDHQAAVDAFRKFMALAEDETCPTCPKEDSMP